MLHAFIPTDGEHPICFYPGQGAGGLSSESIHAFARDLILTRGTDLTDFEVGKAATKYGTI
jgi:hypothetical protein